MHSQRMFNFIKSSLWAVFIFSLCAGTYFRVSQINRQGLWSDELFSVTSVELLKPSSSTALFERKTVQTLSLSDSFLTFKAAEHTPPLFELLLAGSIKLFGDGETAIRLPSVLSSLILLFCIPLLLIRKFGIAAAVCASAFIAFLPLNIDLAHEARAYSLAICLSGLTTVRLAIVLYRARQADANSIRIGWIDFWLHTLLAFVHHYGFVLSYFLIIPRIIFILISDSDSKMQVLFVEAKKIIGIALLPLTWLIFNYHAVLQASGGGFRFNNSSWGTMFMQGVDAVVPYGTIGGSLSYMFLLLLSFLTIRQSRLSAGWKTVIQKLPSSLLVSAILLTISLTYLLLLSLFDSISGNFHVRHFSLIIPVICIGISILLGYLVSSYRLTAILLPVVISAVIYHHSDQIKNLRVAINKEQYREASSLIAQKYRKGDLILSTWRPNQGFYLFYLRKNIGKSVRKDMQSISFKEEITGSCNRIIKKLEKGHKVFLFYHYQHRNLIADLKSACPALDKSEIHKLFGVNVELAVKNLPERSINTSKQLPHRP